MPDRRVVVRAGDGLHARPAAEFVATVAEFPACSVVVARAGESSNAGQLAESARGDSLLAILRLNVNVGDEIALHVEGEDADTLLDRLTELVNGRASSG